MSKSVDERVVQMKFDNRQFEQGVKQTMSTLDKFKQKLNLTGASKSLDNVRKSAQEMNKVSFSNIEKGLNTLTKRFSTFGIAGMSAVNNITNSLIGLAKRAYNFTIGGVTNGGLTRAMRLQEARFQLQGLLKDATAVEEIMKDVNYGVTDTAYSLDAAASVAAQLAASGMRAGEGMQHALRGISGVAAMTNSSYEEIGQIYTKIAGNGRLMGEELLQLSSRGMNAAAILGEQLGKTEQEIREMVSKGKIDFQTFADAMDNAFGEHAKEANRTFNGAMSNIKAALAKIGAEFYEPLISVDGPIVNLLNAIREKINEVKADVIPFLKQAATYIGDIINDIANKVKNGNKFKYNPFVEGEDPETKATKYIRSMEKIKEIADKTGMSIEEVEQNIEKLNSRFLIFTSIKNIGKGIVEIFKSIGRAFKDIFGERAQDYMFNITAAFNKFSTILKDKIINNSDKIYNTFKGIFSVIGAGITIIKGIISVLSKLSGPLVNVAKGILNLTSAFGDWLSNIIQGIQKTEVFNKIISKLGDFLSNFTKGLKDFIQGFFGTFGKAIVAIAKAISNAVKTIFNALAESISSGDAAKFMDLFNKGLFAWVLLKIKNFVNYIGHGGTLFDSIKKWTNSLKTVADNISKVLSTAKNALMTWQHDLQAKTLMKIAAAIGILTLSLITLADIDNDKLKNALSGITMLFADLIVALKILSAGETLKGSTKIMGLALSLSISISILAGAVKKIADIDAGGLLRSTLAIVVLIKVMSTAMSNLATKEGKVIKGASGIIALAISIRVLASACKVFGSMDLEELKKGLVSLLLVLVEFGAFMSLTRFFKNTIEVGAGLIVLSAGLKILASVFKDLDKVSWDGIGKSIVALTAILTAFAAFMSLTRFFKNTIQVGIALNIFVLAIRNMVKPLQELGSMSLTEIAKSLIALSGGLAILTAAVGVLTWIANEGGFWGGINMNFAAMSIEMLTKLLGKIVEAFKGFSSISWDGIVKSLISIGVSIGVLVYATKKLQTKEIGAIIAAAVSLNILAKSIAILGKLGFAGVAAGLLGFAGTFYILATAMKALIPLTKGMIKVAGSIAVLSGSLTLLGLSMGVIGTGLGVFTTSLITAFLGFKLIGWDTIIKGLIGIAGAFTIIAVAAKLLKPLTISILTLAGSIAVFSLSVAAVGVGISLIVQALSTMAAVGKEGAESAGIALKTLIQNILELIPVAIKQLGISLKEILTVFKDIIPMLGNILIEVVHTLVKVLVTTAPEIARGFLELIVQSLQMMVRYIPTIINLLADFIVKTLDTLSIKIPEIIKAVIRFLSKLFDSVVDVFKTFGAGELLKAVISLGVLTLVLEMMAGLAAVTPAAIVGILAFGVLVTELAGVIALVGKLSQIPGFNELVTDGGNFLQKIGTAIGQFVGGIIGGLYKGVTSSLPDIATNLSNFIINLQPFIEGLKTVSYDIIAKMALLSGALVLISEAGLVSSILNLINIGGLGLPLLGLELTAFMNNIQGFIEGTKSISPSILESVASLTGAIMLVTAANLLNNISNFIGMLTGGNNLATFGLELSLLGLGIRQFTNNIGTFSQDEMTSVEFACDALKMLAKTGKEIPNSGGLISAIVGDNDIGIFSTKLPIVGFGLRGFVEALGNFGDEQIKSAKNAAEAIKQLSIASQDIPNSGGIKLLFAGDNDISQFAAKLPLVGACLRLFVNSLGGAFTDEEQSAIGSAGKAIKQLSDAAKDIPKSGGLVTMFTGDNDIASFGTKLPLVGSCLRLFVDSLGSFSDENISTVKAACDTIAAMAESANKIPNSGGLSSIFTGDNDISIFGLKLPLVGSCLRDFAISLGNFGDNQIHAAVSASECIVSMAEAASKVPKSGGLKDIFEGENNIASFGTKLPVVGNCLKLFIKEIGIIGDEQINSAKAATECIVGMAEAASKIPQSNTGLKYLFEGDNSILGFADKLPWVGRFISEFIQSVGDISSDGQKGVESALNVLKTIGEMNIPESGGIAQLFKGENNIAYYASQLPIVGKFISDFMLSVADISSDKKENVTTALDVLKTMGEMNVPESGGILQLFKALFKGENNLASYASQFPIVGKLVSDFMFSVADITPDAKESVTTALDVLKTMGEMKVPETGGIVQFFKGENSLINYAGQFPILGDMLNRFMSSVAELTPDAKERVTIALDVLKSMGEIGNINFENGKKIEEFGACFISFCNKLTEAIQSLGQINSEDLPNQLNKVKQFEDLANSITNIDGTKIEAFGDALKNVGEAGVDAFVESVSGTTAKSQASTSVDEFISNVDNTVDDNKLNIYNKFSEIGQSALDGLRDNGNREAEFEESGKNFVEGFARGINNNIYLATQASSALGRRSVESLNESVDEHSPSKITAKSGRYFTIGFINGINEYASKAGDAAANVGSYATKGLQNAVSKVYDAMSSDIDNQPTIRPVLDLSEIEAGASTLNSMLDINKNLALSANLSSISTSINRRLQNRGNDDVISAIKDLSKSISGSTGDTYNVNGINYSDDAEISDAIRTLVKASVVERRT